MHSVPAAHRTMKSQCFSALWVQHSIMDDCVLCRAVHAYSLERSTSSCQRCSTWAAPRTVIKLKTCQCRKVIACATHDSASWGWRPTRQPSTASRLGRAERSAAAAEGCRCRPAHCAGHRPKDGVSALSRCRWMQEGCSGGSEVRVGAHMCCTHTSHQLVFACLWSYLEQVNFAWF